MDITQTRSAGRRVPRRLVLLAIAISATLTAGLVSAGVARADTAPQDVYDPAAAVRWASAHAYDDAATNDYPDDCTDFVSKALHAGGMEYRLLPTASPASYNDDQHWFPGGILNGDNNPMAKASYSWAGAYNLWDFLQISKFGTLVASGTGQQNPDMSNVQPGDVIFVNWKAPGEAAGFDGIDHSGIIVGDDGVAGDLKIAQHSHNRIDMLTDWRNEAPDLTWWIYSIKITTPPDNDL